MEKKKVRDYIATIGGFKQFRNRVDEIIEHFDFEKVHKVMELLNWRWACYEDENYEDCYDTVPSVGALRIQARKLLIDAVDKGYGGCGGFEVSCFVYEDGPEEEGDPDDFEHSVHLELKFVIESGGSL